MAKYKNQKLKRILIIVISSVLAIGTITGLAFGLKPKDTKKTTLSYHIGSIDDSGAYVQNDEHMYSDLFKCQGLVVEPEFDSNVKYRIYFYRHDKTLISENTTGFLTNKYELKDDMVVKYARILVVPDLGDKDKITFWNKRGFAKNLNITVNKEQPEATNYYDVKEKNVKWQATSSELKIVDSTGYIALEKFDCSNMKQLEIVPISDVYVDVEISVIYKVGDDYKSPYPNPKLVNSDKVIIDVEAGATEVYISCNQDLIFDIYVYA